MQTTRKFFFKKRRGRERKEREGRERGAGGTMEDVQKGEDEEGEKFKM